MDRDLGGLPVHLEVRGLDGDAAALAYEAGFAEASRRADLLLAERPASEIDVLNQVPMQIEIALSPATIAALAAAQDVAEDTDGAYDPTARAPLERLWGLDEGTPHRPRSFEIAAALRSVDWTDVAVDPEAGTASRLSRHTRIDLGPVAVGAVLDGATDAAMRAGARAALASARGIFVARGDDRPFAIPLSLGAAANAGRARLPLADGAAAVALPGPALATADGETIRLPFDPRSGLPAGSADWALARCSSGARAGGVAAALLVMGDRAPAWLESASGDRGALRLSDGHRYVSPGMGIVFEDAP